LRTTTLALLLWSVLVYGGVSGSLEGIVTDDSTGEPLIGANVVVVEAGQGTVTDTLGFFRIHNIRAGVYDVKASMIGYRPVTSSGVLVLPDRRAVLNVRLRSSPIEMQAVVVVVERPLIETDITGTVYHVDAGGLIDLPVDSFQDVIGLQPSTTVEGHIRGGKVRETIYLVDGLPVQDLIEGGAGVALPLSAISQMTIQTGGFDAEYGDALSGVVNIISRSGGHQHEQSLRLAKDDLFGGEEVNHRNDVELTVSGPLGSPNLSYFWASNLVLTDTRWWQDAQHFFDSPIGKELNGLAKVDYNSPANGRLTAELIYSLRRWRDYEFSWRYNLDGLPRRLRDSYRAALLWTGALSPHTALSASLSHFSLHSKIGEGSAGDIDPTPYDYDFYLLYVTSGSRSWWADQQQRTYTLKADLTQELHKRHFIKTGIELKQYDIDADLLRLEPQTTFFGRPLVFAPQLNYSTRYHYYPRAGSAYVQDRIESANRSTLSFGVRLDFLDPRAARPAVELVPTTPEQYSEEVTGFITADVKVHISPRLGASFPLSERSVFFVNFGEYVQFPLFDYLYSGLDNVSLRDGVNVLRGNPDLLAEKTRAFEVSLRHELTDEWVGSVTYFRKETRDQIDAKTFVPTNSRIAGDYGFSEFVNNPEASAKGYEFLLSRPRGKVRGNVSYALMRTEGLSESEDQGINLAQWGFPVANTPFPLSWDQRHTVKADVTMDLPGGAKADFVWQSHSGRPYTYFPSADGFTADDPDRPFIPNNRRLPSYSLLNLKISSPVPMWWGVDMTAYMDVRNATDALNVRWVDSSGKVGGELEDPSAYYPLRRLLLGLRAQF
jgi:outer membrane receptor protein involved in Fe transport